MIDLLFNFLKQRNKFTWSYICDILALETSKSLTQWRFNTKLPNLPNYQSGYCNIKYLT